MFELNLVDIKDALNNLLNINVYWLFDKGRICSLHDQKYVFSVLEEPKIRMKNPSLNDMNELVSLLKSKTIVKVKVSPDSGHVVIFGAQEGIDKIPIVAKPDWLKETQRWYKNLLRLEYTEEEEWKDDYGGMHTLCDMTVDNVEFADAIDQVGISENLEIKTGSKLTLTNKKTGKVRRLPKINTEDKVSIMLSKDGQSYLENALLGEKSEILIADQAIILVKNKCKTMIAGRLE